MPSSSLLGLGDMALDPMHNGGPLDDTRSLHLALEQFNKLSLGHNDLGPPSASPQGLNLFPEMNGYAMAPTMNGVSMNGHLDNHGPQGPMNIGYDQSLSMDASKKSQNMTECVPVPSSEHVAEIVGRQGCKIKALRAKTNTYIKTPVRGEEPVFVVTGRKEDVAMAKREIISAAEHFSQIRASRKSSQSGSSGGGSVSTGGFIGPPHPIPPGQTTLQVRVPYRVVGLVVGPKGATIKRIQQETHTYIVTPSRDKEPIFEVTGSPDNVQTAQQSIEAHIAVRTGGIVDTQTGETTGYTNASDWPLSGPIGEWSNDDVMSNVGVWKSPDGSSGQQQQQQNGQHQQQMQHHHQPQQSNGWAKDTSDIFAAFNGGTVGMGRQQQHIGGGQMQQQQQQAPPPPNNYNQFASYWDADEGISSPGAFDSVGPSGQAPGSSSSAWPDFSRHSMFTSAGPTSMAPQPLAQAQQRSISLSNSSSPPPPVGGPSTLAPAIDHQGARRMQSDPLSGGLGAGLGPALALLPPYSGATGTQSPSSSPTNSTGSGQLMPSGGPGPVGSLPDSQGSAPGSRKDAKECMVCYSSDVVAALVPCGHNKFCMDCAQKLTSEGGQCPVCSQKVNQAIRIFS